MTVVTKNLVSSSLLYLAIDVGDRPTMAEYSRQVDSLNVLWWHCVGLSQPPVPPQRGERPPVTYSIANPSSIPYRVRMDLERTTPLLVTRTSMASPWVSILTTIAEKSAPVGYGLAAVFALQRLLNMTMAWQRHRVYIRASEQNLQSDRALARFTMQQAKERERAESVLVDHAMAELNEHQRRPDRGSDGNFESVTFGGEEVKEAAAELAPVLEATMIDEDDPRATGLTS